MARLRYNGLTATLGADLLTADTTITFSAALTSAAGAVPTITGTDYIPLAVLDTDGSVLEIIHLTAYTTGATTGTVARAQESTTAADHATGLTVVNGMTVADATEFEAGGGGIESWQAPSTSGLTLSATMTDIPGCSVTVTDAVAGDVFLITGVIDATAGSGLALGALYVGATEQATLITANASRVTASQTWRITGVSGSVTFKLRAVRNSGTGGSINYPHSTLTVLRLAA